MAFISRVTIVRTGVGSSVHSNAFSEASSALSPQPPARPPARPHADHAGSPQQRARGSHAADLIWHALSPLSLFYPPRGVLRTKRSKNRLLRWSQGQGSSTREARRQLFHAEGSPYLSSTGDLLPFRARVGKSQLGAPAKNSLSRGEGRRPVKNGSQHTSFLIGPTANAPPKMAGTNQAMEGIKWTLALNAKWLSPGIVWERTDADLALPRLGVVLIFFTTVFAGYFCLPPLLRRFCTKVCLFCLLRVGHCSTNELVGRKESRGELMSTPIYDTCRLLGEQSPSPKDVSVICYLGKGRLDFPLPAPPARLQ